MNADTFLESGAQWDTIGDLIRGRAQHNPTQLAVEVCGRRLTYGDLDVLSDRIAANLAAIEVTKGDMVGSFAFNCVEQLLIWFGCSKIGAIWVPLNVSLVGADLAYSICDSNPKVLITDSETYSKIEAILAELPGTIRHYCIDDLPNVAPFSQLLKDDLPPPAADVYRHDPAVIIYTGGTTGLPKGVVLPHYAWIAAGYRYVEAFGITPQDIHYSVLSLFHVGGLMVGIMGPIVAGIPTFVDRWFSVRNFWPRVRETGATVIDPIGTMVTLLCRAESSPDDNHHSVRVAMGVLNQVPAEIADQFAQRFDIQIVNVYSLTETGGTLIVHNKIGSIRPKSNGKTWGWADIRIVDDQDRQVPCNQIGEIILRPTVPFTFMLQYHNSPAKTLECFRNLWLHTGDLGFMDNEGYLFFVGRKAHRLRVRGENVSAYEVEDTLSRYPGILEVIVVGVPSELGDEEIKAFVIPKEGADFEPAAMVTWCQHNLAAYKVPRFVTVLQEFPRSITKREVERHKLRDMPNDTAWDAEKVFGRRSMRSQR